MRLFLQHFSRFFRKKAESSKLYFKIPKTNLTKCKCRILSRGVLLKQPLEVNETQHRYFAVKLAKFLRTPIVKNVFERLLLVLIWNNFLDHSEKQIEFSSLFKSKGKIKLLAFENEITSS